MAFRGPCLASALAFCAFMMGPSSAVRKISGEPTVQDAFSQFMGVVKTTEDPEGFNPICEPFVKEPEGESRGLVMLVHGFTACPGFWVNLAAPLVAEGWTVMAPVLPGHGRMAKVEETDNGSFAVTDWLNDIPVVPKDYEDYASELISITERYRAENPSKEMVLVGCSHGGAISTYMAMNSQVGTWDRIMLLNPFLAPPTGLGADYGISGLRDLLPELLPAIGGIFMDDISWGEPCDRKRWPTDWRHGGTGGTCHFSLENFQAVLKFANEVEGEARSRAASTGVFTGGIIDRAEGFRLWTRELAWRFLTGQMPPQRSKLQVQLLATAFDGAVSNARIHFLSKALRKSTTNPGYCVLPKEFTHTWINPNDKLDYDAWWMDPNRIVGGRTVIENLVDFVNEGTLFPVSDQTETEDRALIGAPLCDVEEWTG